MQKAISPAIDALINQGLQHIEEGEFQQALSSFAAAYHLTIKHSDKFLDFITHIDIAIDPIINADYTHNILKDFIQLKRNLLCAWGKNLKKRYVDGKSVDGKFFTTEFDPEVVQLLVALLEHDHKMSIFGLESDEARIKTLGNICATLAILSKSFTDSFTVDGEHSIIRDLILLGTATFPQSNALYEQRLPVDSADLIQIVKEDLHEQLLPYLRSLLATRNVGECAYLLEQKSQLEQEILSLRLKINGAINNGTCGLKERAKILRETHDHASHKRAESERKITDQQNEIQIIRNDLEYENETIRQCKEKSQKSLQSDASAASHMSQKNLVAFAKTLPSEDALYSEIKKSKREIGRLESKLSDAKRNLSGWRKKQLESEKTLAEINNADVAQAEAELVAAEAELAIKIQQKDSVSQKIEAQHYSKFSILVFPSLYRVVNYHRERLALNKVLEFCEADAGDSYTPESVFYRLIKIGEQFTKKNMSEKTLNNLIEHANSLGINIKWDLLIKIRNKLAHAEWDVFSRELLKYLKNSDVSSILRNDLNQLTYVIMTFIQSNSWKNRSYAYYDHISLPAGAPPANNALSNIEKLFQSLPDETYLNSSAGRKFVVEQQLLILFQLLEHIEALEDTFSTFDNFNRKDLEYALRDDVIIISDKKGKQASTFLATSLAPHSHANSFASFFIKPINVQEIDKAVESIKLYHNHLEVELPRPSNVESMHMNEQPALINPQEYLKYIIQYGKLCNILAQISNDRGIDYKLQFHLSIIFGYKKLCEICHEFDISSGSTVSHAYIRRNTFRIEMNSCDKTVMI